MRTRVAIPVPSPMTISADSMRRCRGLTQPGYNEYGSARVRTDVE